MLWEASFVIHIRRRPQKWTMTVHMNLLIYVMMYRRFHPHPSIFQTYISKTSVNGFDKSGHIQIIKSLCDIDVQVVLIVKLVGWFPFQLASSHSNGDVAAVTSFWFLIQILRHFDLRISNSSTWHLDLCSCFVVWQAHSHQSERGA